MPADPVRSAQAILRAEYRFDDSRGTSGGFFNDGQMASAVGLTPRQQLFVVGVILTFESSFR